MHISYLPLMRCPQSKSELTLEGAHLDGDFIQSGWLISKEGTRYPIDNYIPRFTKDDYCESFSLEWEKHPSILLENSSNLTSYRTRFSEATRWPDDLSGEIILEAGCGPGSFTGLALERKARVIAIDLSNSVDKAQRSIERTPDALFVQADIAQLPFADETFDRTFCFGVIQHTQSPRATFRELVRILKPGGAVAVDTYIVPEPQKGGGHILVDTKYKVRRHLPKFSPAVLHHLISLYVNIMWLPTRCIRCLFKNGDDINRRLLIDDYSYRLPGVSSSRYREFAVLDIFDFLSPVYDEPQTTDSFREFFTSEKLHNIDVHPGWNGIEGRGVKPNVLDIA